MRTVEIAFRPEQFRVKVTKPWMIARLQLTDKKIVVGRALLAIYKNQTAEEQGSKETKFNNGIGFTKPDANLGTRCAKEFALTGTLPDWMFNLWIKPNVKGEPRIVKYCRQLNDIAISKLNPITDATIN